MSTSARQLIRLLSHKNFQKHVGLSPISCTNCTKSQIIRLPQQSLNQSIFLSTIFNAWFPLPDSSRTIISNTSGNSTTFLDALRNIGYYNTEFHAGRINSTLALHSQL
ncbi:21192_t:CDS:1 [Gigaspora margarita]|uniref:21192_t:CDS:1 n=1 Tax=Gigaspora margarita TaxID=4874 RepID=A0ABN7VS17_GIGMA|nr:21192_t:CDS:1 [Gigaspora margarita]